MGGTATKCCCDGPTTNSEVLVDDAALLPLNSQTAQPPTPRKEQDSKDDDKIGVDSLKDMAVLSEPQVEPVVNELKVVEEKPGIVVPEKVEETVNNEPEAEQESAPLEFQDRQFATFLTKMPTPPNKPSSLPRRPSSVGINLQSYCAKHASGWDEFKAMEPMDGWNLKTEESGVQIYLKPSKDNGFLSFKAVTEIPCDPARIPALLTELLNIEKRTEWDKMCLEARSVESFTPFYRFTYVRMASPAAIIANRDLCLLGRIQFTEDGGVLMHLKSELHPDAPVAKNHVRCEMLCGGYSFRPVPGKKSVRMTYCGTVDPKGWIPLWVANHVAWKQGLALVLFKKSLETAGIV